MGVIVGVALGGAAQPGKFRAGRGEKSAYTHEKIQLGQSHTGSYLEKGESGHTDQEKYLSEGHSGYCALGELPGVSKERCSVLH